MQTLTIESRENKQVIDITEQVNSALERAGIASGVCLLFAMHTTVALTLMDLDPGTDLDMLDALRTLMPELDYRHSHAPEHTPDHILSAVIGPSLMVPIEGGRLHLGIWQRVVLLEFQGPRSRDICVSVMPEDKG